MINYFKGSFLFPDPRTYLHSSENDRGQVVVLIFIFIFGRDNSAQVDV